MKIVNEADLVAAVAAIDGYEAAAQRLFEAEDDFRRRGKVPEADTCHYWGLVAGHAAYLELRDPEPRA